MTFEPQSRSTGGRKMPVLTGVLAIFGLAAPVASAAGWDPERDDPEREYDRYVERAVPRDAFPVFTEPRMVSRKTADRRMRPNEWVIGVSIDGDARAYPVEVMGVHELGNDTVGGEPITVCW